MYINFGSIISLVETNVLNNFWHAFIFSIYTIQSCFIVWTYMYLYNVRMFCNQPCLCLQWKQFWMLYVNAVIAIRESSSSMQVLQYDSQVGLHTLQIMIFTFCVEAIWIYLYGDNYNSIASKYPCNIPV